MTTTLIPPYGKGIKARISGAVELATGTPLRKDVFTIMAGLFAILLPTWATLVRVNGPAPMARSLNPVYEGLTPRGYTWSLLLFVLPVLLIWGTERWKHRDHVTRQATRFAFLFIAGWGLLLDFLFGHAFLNFPNPDATVKLRVPAMTWAPFGLSTPYLPVEEFAFYVLGGLFLVWLYVWADKEWVPGYSVSRGTGEVKRGERLVLQGTLPTTLRIVAVWLGCVAIGVFYKIQRHDPTWFPGYFVFIMVIGFLPTLLFFRAVHDTVNWRAFTLAYLMLLLISIIWEVTLGLPYGWWGYNPEAMLGMKVTAWHDLPVEAVLLWLVVSWVSVTAFEVARLYHQMPGSFVSRVFGRGRQ